MRRILHPPPPRGAYLPKPSACDPLRHRAHPQRTLRNGRPKRAGATHSVSPALHHADARSVLPLLYLITRLAWSAHGRCRHTVLVYGRIVVEDGHCTTVDEVALWAKAQRMCESITARSCLPDKAKFPTL